VTAACVAERLIPTAGAMAPASGGRRRRRGLGLVRWAAAEREITFASGRDGRRGGWQWLEPRERAPKRCDAREGHTKRQAGDASNAKM
jgi:hypothetical protein